MSNVNKGTDPYNTADPAIEVIEFQPEHTIDWKPQPDAPATRQIVYNDEYWREVWGMKIIEED
jgi:hypothetical protein